MGFVEIESEENIPLCPLHGGRTIRLTIGGRVEISCDRCGGKVRGLFDWCVHVHNLNIEIQARPVNPIHALPPEPVSQPSGASGGTKVAPQPVEPLREPEKADSRPSGEVLDPLAEITNLQRRHIWSDGRISDLYNHVFDLLVQGQQLEQRITFIEGAFSGLKAQNEYLQKVLNHFRETVAALPANLSRLEDVVADLVNLKLTK